MDWLLAGGEVLAGTGVLVAWWLVVKLLGKSGERGLTNMRFVLLPSFMLLWLVAGVVLVLRGFGVV